MSYIKPNGSEDRYEVTLTPTMTQSGYSAIRFLGEEVPNNYTDGFKYYNDNDEEISDLSEYKFNFCQNVYSEVEDEIIEPKPNNESPNGSNVNSGIAVASAISDLRRKVNAMETYTESKNVYIDDTECVFEVEKSGSVSAQLSVNGVVTPCSYTVDGNRITVTFEPLEDLGVVTIFILQ